MHTTLIINPLANRSQPYLGINDAPLSSFTLHSQKGPKPIAMRF
jgi:hypothetical protein